LLLHRRTYESIYNFPANLTPGIAKQLIRNKNKTYFVKNSNFYSFLSNSHFSTDGMVTIKIYSSKLPVLPSAKKTLSISSARKPNFTMEDFLAVESLGLTVF
jgi:hypothetical protein